MRFYCNNDKNPYDYKFVILNDYKIELVEALYKHCECENSTITITAQKVTDFKSVNYSAISIMTQKAVNYLHNKLTEVTTEKDELKVKVDDLTTENIQLKQRLANIEDILNRNNIS